MRAFAEVHAVANMWGKAIRIMIWVESQGDYISVPVGPTHGDPIRIIWNGVNHYDVWRDHAMRGWQGSTG